MSGRGLGDIFYTHWTAGMETKEYRRRLFASDIEGYGLVDVRGIKDPKKYAGLSLGTFPPFKHRVQMGVVGTSEEKYGRMAIYHGPLKGYNTDDIVEDGAPERAFAFSLAIIRRNVKKDSDTRPSKIFSYSCIMGERQYNVVLNDVTQHKEKRDLFRKRCIKVFPEWWNYFLNTTKLHGDIGLFDDPDKFQRHWKHL